jgi:hypothetical protein
MRTFRALIESEIPIATDFCNITELFGQLFTFCRDTTALLMLLLEVTGTGTGNALFDPRDGVDEK